MLRQIPTSSFFSVARTIVRSATNSAAGQPPSSPPQKIDSPKNYLGNFMVVTVNLTAINTVILMGKTEWLAILAPLYLTSMLTQSIVNQNKIIIEQNDKLERLLTKDHKQSSQEEPKINLKKP